MLDIASGSVHDIWVSNSGTDVLDASIGVFLGLWFLTFSFFFIAGTIPSLHILQEDSKGYIRRYT